MKTSPFYILSLFVLIIRCSDNPISTEEKTWEIQIPINKTAIYAYATYLETEGEIKLDHLAISSLSFTEQADSNDTTYFSGSIEQYIPAPYENSGSTTGNLIISLTDDWVLFNNISDNLNPFQHFPVYPRLLKEDQSNEIIHKENSTDDSLKKLIYRKFQAGKAMTWDDRYGSQDGIFVKTLQHSFKNDSLFFNTMFDEFGVVISQFSIAIIFIDNPNPENNDTIYFHQINRRIRNYSDPLLVPELKTFADKIISNPLKFFIEN